LKAAGEGVLRVLATKEDYGGLAEHLAAIGRTIVVGFKATGTYRRALTYYLITAGFELWLISSIAWHGRARPCIMGGMRTSPKEVQVILHNAADRRHSALRRLDCRWDQRSARTV